MSELPVGWKDAALEAANLDMSNDESPRFFAKIIAIRTANRLAALQAKHIAELEARLAQVEGDAGRYRWLRDIGDSTWAPMGARVPEGAAGVDAAIDAAMKEQKNG